MTDVQPRERFDPQLHQADPHAYLRAKMPVRGEQGKTLGKVETVEHDPSGVLSAITVRHGLLGRQCTRVPAERIKQVNQDSVVIQFIADRFKGLPRMER